MTMTAYGTLPELASNSEAWRAYEEELADPHNTENALFHGIRCRLPEGKREALEEITMHEIQQLYKTGTSFRLRTGYFLQEPITFEAHQLDPHDPTGSYEHMFNELTGDSYDEMILRSKNRILYRSTCGNFTLSVREMKDDMRKWRTTQWLLTAHNVTLSPSVKKWNRFTSFTDEDFLCAENNITVYLSELGNVRLGHAEDLVPDTNWTVVAEDEAKGFAPFEWELETVSDDSGNGNADSEALSDSGNGDADNEHRDALARRSSHVSDTNVTGTSTNTEEDEKCASSQSRDSQASVPIPPSEGANSRDDEPAEPAGVQSLETATPAGEDTKLSSEFVNALTEAMQEHMCPGLRI